MKLTELFIVTVSYNNSRCTLEMIESALQVYGVDVNKIVVVDNCSNSIERALLQDGVPKYADKVEVLYSDKNLGYFPGLNEGIRFIRDQLHPTAAVFVGNNDIKFSADFGPKLQDLDSKVLANPVISPRITSSCGLEQNPHVINHISTLRELAYMAYYSIYPVACLLKIVSRLLGGISKRDDEAQYQTSRHIWQGYGAAYLLTPAFFERWDELWAPTWLYHEELFLAKMLSDAGAEIWYESSVQLIHEAHSTTKMMPGHLKWKASRASYWCYRRENF